MAFKDFLIGKPAQSTQLSRFTPSQQNLANMVGGNAQSLLSTLMGNISSNQSGFAPIAQQARTRFQQQTVPSIAERFTSMGAGAQSSPAFAQLLGQAGAGLEEGLAAQEGQYGLQQQGLLQSLLSNLLSHSLAPQFEQVYQPAQQGLLQSLFPGLFGGGASLIGNALFGIGKQASSSQEQPTTQAPFNPIGINPYNSPYGANAIDLSLFNALSGMGNNSQINTPLGRQAQ